MLAAQSFEDISKSGRVGCLCDSLRRKKLRERKEEWVCPRMNCPDGNLWFTEYQANQIGRITTGK